MGRDSFYQQSLGNSLNRSVKEARILMVGAGGIGCELLKNLVLSGYGEIHIVDLDTIDLSNLNRQFLFRHEHIKKSKALVAKEAAHRFNPAVKLVAHHANIKDSQFNVSWFKGFTLVFNALDNLEARRHVNKMCLSADVPLIESGTTGFNGQVQVIKKGVTACYDCASKPVAKSFPVCTIRSTPSQPIHCIVWAKSYLLSEIFGASEDESPEVDRSEDSENAQEIEKLRQESQALKKIREAMGTEEFPQLLFDKVYKDDIVRLRSMDEMWKTRRPPEPLDYHKAVAEGAAASFAKVEAILMADQKPWKMEENVAVFKDSLSRLSTRIAEMQSNGDAAPIITFDKDDEDTLDFVTAGANIRAIIFGIEPKSRFDVKQMAGNIIPAIATTNAMVAGLCVLESFKVLKGDYSETKEVFLSPFTTERLLATDRNREPNPECPVCSVAQSRLAVDMSRAILSDLVDMLRLDLGYGEEFSINTEAGLLYDVEETENLETKLSDLGIKNDTFLTVIDDDEDEPRVNLILIIQETLDRLQDKPIKSLDLIKSESGERPIRARPAPPPSASVANGVPTNGNGVHTDADGNEEGLNASNINPGSVTQPGERLTLSTPGEPAQPPKRPQTDAEEPAPKRSKLSQNGLEPTIGAINLEDDDGFIVLD